jgi:polyisoprenoid-binding protein YceI
VTDLRTSPPTPTREPARSTSRSRRRRPILIASVGFLLVAVLGATVWYFVFRDTAPPPVKIDAAAGALSGGTAAAGTTELDGTWIIDTSVGSFSDFTSAFLGYRVDEELAGVGAKTAYGRTPDVSGSLTIDGTTITAVAVQADLTTLESDDSQRDNAIRTQALETDRYGTAEFTLTEPIELDDIPADGETVRVDAVAALTLHGETRTVTIPLEAQMVNGEIAVTGQLDVAFADYGIEKPSSFKVLSVDDHGLFELQLFFAKQ